MNCLQSEGTLKYVENPLHVYRFLSIVAYLQIFFVHLRKLHNYVYEHKRAENRITRNEG